MQTSTHECFYSFILDINENKEKKQKLNNQ